MGIYYVSKISNKMGLMSKEELEKTKYILKLYSLPTECPYTSDEIYAVAVSDKKVATGSINLVIPYSIGDTRLYKVDLKDLPSILEMGV